MQLSPFFDYRSVKNFHDGVNKQMFVKDAGGSVPGLTRWQNGPAVAMLDVSLVSSRAWFNTLVMTLLEVGVCWFVCWLLNVPAAGECISGTDLLRQVYVLPH